MSCRACGSSTFLPGRKSSETIQCPTCGQPDWMWKKSPFSPISLAPSSERTDSFRSSPLLSASRSEATSRSETERLEAELRLLYEMKDDIRMMKQQTSPASSSRSISSIPSPFPVASPLFDLTKRKKAKTKTCPSSHPLLPSTEGGPWRCDLCSAIFPERSERWVCEHRARCDFDACFRCIPAIAPSPASSSSSSRSISSIPSPFPVASPKPALSTADAARDAALKTALELKRLRTTRHPHDDGRIRALETEAIQQSVSFATGRRTSTPLTTDNSPPNWVGLQTTLAKRSASAIELQLARPADLTIPKNLRLDRMSVNRIECSIAVRPFSMGGCRYAYHCAYRTPAIAAAQNRFVAKAMIDGDDEAAVRALESIVLIHDITSEIVDQFNARLSSTNVSLLQAVLLDFGSHGRPRYMTVEPFLDARFMKFTDNVGYVFSEAHDIPPALSHFSHSISNGELMLVDIQGFIVNGCYVLTDPALHSREHLFGGTDFGAEGFQAFFDSHKCNATCRALKLPVPLSKTATDMEDLRRRFGHLGVGH